MRKVYFDKDYIYVAKFDKIHLSDILKIDERKIEFNDNGETRNIYFFFSSRRRHTRLTCDWSSDVCSSDLHADDHGKHDDLDQVGGAQLDVEGEVLLKGIQPERLDPNQKPGRDQPAEQARDDPLDQEGQLNVEVRGRSEERRVGKECRTRMS